MESIAMFNNKGGVGKTTLLCNLAAYLCKARQKKVLVIDADPQCNSTTYALEEIELPILPNASKLNTSDDIGVIK